MISIRNCEILDLLPYTFKTPRRQALSKALMKVRAKCFDTMSAVLFWGDIENASPVVFDAMAAELDAPFYSGDMDNERKRAIIAAAFEYNSRIGTVSSINELLTAAFGGGSISEWYEYGGQPYYFKANISRTDDTSINYNNYSYFLKMLEKIKNKRAKLEDISINNNLKNDMYFGGAVVRTKKYVTIQSE